MLKKKGGRMYEVRLLYGATIPGNQLLCTDLLWKTRFQAPDPFFLCELPNGGRILLVGALEYERAKKESRDCIIELSDGSVEGERGVGKFLQERGVTHVAVPTYMPAEILHGLWSMGLRMVLQDPSQYWYPERIKKDSEEVEKICEVQKKAEKVLYKVVRMLRESSIRDDGVLVDRKAKEITAERIRDFMEVELMKQGCIAATTIIACGDQAVDPHCQGSGPLRANLPIVIDVFPRSKTHWYWSDMTRTFFKGSPSPAAEKMYQAVLDAQNTAINMIRAGVDGSAIQKRVTEFFEERGYQTGVIDGNMQGFFHSVGHGVGLDIHEAPRISKNPYLLPKGSVVTVEPGLYYLGIGGVRIEDMVLVEEGGARSLTSFPKELKDMIIP